MHAANFRTMWIGLLRPKQILLLCESKHWRPMFSCQKWTWLHVWRPSTVPVNPPMPYPSASHQRSFLSRLNLSKVFQPRALSIGAKSLAARFKTQKVRGIAYSKTIAGNAWRKHSGKQLFTTYGFTFTNKEKGAGLGPRIDPSRR